MIDFLDFLPYAGSAITPLTIYIFVGRYLARRAGRRLLALHDLPCPKPGPSDWVIYRYGSAKEVSSRWVHADKTLADQRVQIEKSDGHTGRLFKDGNMIKEW